MTPAEIISDVRLLTQDVSTPVRNSDTVLLGIVNQVLKRMVAYRPDLFITSAEVATTEDVVEQSLPSGAVRLLEIFSVVDGDAVTEVNRETLDQMYPGWTQVTAGTPLNWMRHQRNPTKYFLYPKPSADIELMAEYIATPTTYALTDTITELTEAYRGILIDGSVYLVESVDTESIGNGRAQFYYDMWVEAMGTDMSQRALVDSEGAQVGAGQQQRQRRRQQNDGA